MYIKLAFSIQSFGMNSYHFNIVKLEEGPELVKVLPLYASNGWNKHYINFPVYFFNVSDLSEATIKRIIALFETTHGFNSENRNLFFVTPDYISDQNPIVHNLMVALVKTLFADQEKTWGAIALSHASLFNRSLPKEIKREILSYLRTDAPYFYKQHGYELENGCEVGLFQKSVPEDVRNWILAGITSEPTSSEQHKQPAKIPPDTKIIQKLVDAADEMCAKHYPGLGRS